MAKVFCVSYDLKEPDGDYTGLYNALAASKHWWRYLASTWLVATEESQEELWKRLEPHIRVNDRILVTGVTPESAGWLPEKAWDWIEQNVDALQTA